MIEFVLSSTITLPLFEITPLLRADEPSSCERFAAPWKSAKISEALAYLISINSVRSGASSEICCRDSSSCFSRACSSAAGPTISTLPISRLSRPLVFIIISSAWSHGTFLRRKVILPATVSLATRLKSVKSAIN